MEKIPSLDMEAIKREVHDFTEGEFTTVFGGRAGLLIDGKTVFVDSAEEYVAEYTKHDRPITHEELVKILTVFLESGYQNENSQKLAKLLIDNPRYARKMVLVSDGSYRNNRIWLIDKCLSIDCMRSYGRRDYVDFTGKSVKYKLNWMWNHYDVIYFQVPEFSTIGCVYW